jgi:hypothetical protein
MIWPGSFNVINDLRACERPLQVPWENGPEPERIETFVDEVEMLAFGEEAGRQGRRKSAKGKGGLGARYCAVDWISARS